VLDLRFNIYFLCTAAFGTDSELSRLQFCVDIEILEKEYTLTEALYMLSSVNSRSKSYGARPTNHAQIMYFLILKISILQAPFFVVLQKAILSKP
jgi:hypothetical protein